MINSHSRHRDIILILIASFFYMTSPMLITPIIAGFSETLGANGTTMADWWHYEYLFFSQSTYHRHIC